MSAIINYVSGILSHVIFTIKYVNLTNDFQIPFTSYEHSCNNNSKTSAMKREDIEREKDGYLNNTEQSDALREGT